MVQVNKRLLYPRRPLIKKKIFIQPNPKPAVMRIRNRIGIRMELGHRIQIWSPDPGQAK
jgi:hypothetical protein